MCVTPILFWMDRTLACVALMPMPVILAFALIFFRRVKQQFAAADVAEAELTGVLQENPVGVRVVRAFARQSYEIERCGARNAAFRGLSVRLARLMGMYLGASDFVCVTQYGLVLLFGATRALQGEINLGTLQAVLVATGACSGCNTTSTPTSTQDATLSAATPSKMSSACPSRSSIIVPSAG